MMIELQAGSGDRSIHRSNISISFDYTPQDCRVSSRCSCPPIAWRLGLDKSLSSSAFPLIVPRHAAEHNNAAPRDWYNNYESRSGCANNVASFYSAVIVGFFCFACAGSWWERVCVKEQLISHRNRECRGDLWPLQSYSFSLRDCWGERELHRCALPLERVCRLE